MNIKNLSAVQISGQTINCIKEAFLNIDFAKKIIIETVGEDINPNEYYPAKFFLNALKTIEQKMKPVVLKNVGSKIKKSAKWPPYQHTFPEAYRSISQAYKLNHKPNDSSIIGDYIYEKIDNKTVKITCTNPYPCDFDEGILLGVARANKWVIEVEHSKKTCRKEGDGVCVYRIKYKTPPKSIL